MDMVVELILAWLSPEPLKICQNCGPIGGSPTLVETVLVLAGQRPRLPAAPTVDALVKELGVTVVACGEREYEAAIDAFLRFGRGRHPANLNFGDCLSYGAAAAAQDSLLFVGADFARTDIPRA